MHSQIGVGTKFTFELCAEACENDERSASNRAKSATDLRGVRVLLAEDGADTRRLIGAYLEHAGAQVTCAENGREACTRATVDGPFDLVLMDVQMPEMDGLTATRQLRDHGYDTPIVSLTANALNGDRERCLAAGCDAYLPKPVSRDDLLRVVSEMTHGRRDPDDMAG